MKYLIFLALISSCGAKIQSTRMSTAQGDEQAMSITDEWVMTDTKLAIKEVISQVQRHNGYRRYLSKMQGRPKIFIAEVQNNTADAYFPVADLNDELLNEFSISGGYVLIDEAARNRILNEIKYQNDGMIKMEDVRKIGKQSGANLLIFGTINMRPHTLNGKTIKEYSVNIRMTDIESGEEVLRTRYTISKYSKRSNFSF